MTAPATVNPIPGVQLARTLRDAGWITSMSPRAGRPAAVLVAFDTTSEDLLADLFEAVDGAAAVVDVYPAGVELRVLP